MTYSLPDLLEGFVDAGGIEAIAATGIGADSRAISSGEVFFALPGTHVHGDAFCAQAVANGAIAIVSDRMVVPDPGVAVVVVEDVRAAYARAAAKVAGPQPAHLAAVTGTSGKTSIASFVRQIWQAAGLKGASVGTLGVQAGDRTATPGALTTPDSLTLHKSLAVLKSGGFDHVIVEASSHGLDQRRLDGISFEVVGFSNLSHDHLDYHADMDEYREAKLRLFRTLLADDGAAVVNSDDPEHMPFMFAALDRGTTLLTVGTEGAFFEIASVAPEGMGQRVRGKLVGEDIDVHLPLVGRFQVDNAALAAAIAIATGVKKEKVIAALSGLRGAKGRLEHVSRHNGADIFVDYAHKPDALGKALEALRPNTRGRLCVVFGCGGDRDRTKRPMMGEIAAELADRVYVTDDNPRNEDAGAIRREVLAAAPGAVEVPDRGQAILDAMADLAPGDVLLIAGKGHEDYQIIGEEKLAFSDHDVVKQAVKA